MNRTFVKFTETLELFGYYKEADVPGLLNKYPNDISKTARDLKDLNEGKWVKVEGGFLVWFNFIPENTA